MKTFIGIICFLVMIVLVVTILAVDFKISVLSPSLRDPLGISSILAAETNIVACTVTPKLISVAISGSDGAVAYGTIALGKQTSTITLGDTEIAENDGTAVAKFNISSTEASGSGTNWSLQTSTGTIHHFVHKYSTDAASTWITFENTGYYHFAYNVPIAHGTDSRSIDLFIAIPTSTDNYAQKSITVTVQAVSP